MNKARRRLGPIFCHQFLIHARLFSNFNDFQHFLTIFCNIRQFSAMRDGEKSYTIMIQTKQFEITFKNWNFTKHYQWPNTCSLLVAKKYFQSVINSDTKTLNHHPPTHGPKTMYNIFHYTQVNCDWFIDVM